MVETETIRIEVPVPLGVKDTLGGLTVVVSVEEEKSATEPENPFLLARSISEEFDPPGAAVRRVLTDDMVKSGPVTLTAMYVMCERLQPFDPSTVTV